MWEILEHRRVDQQLASTPLEILKRYEKWKDIVRFSGPKGLLEIRGFRDEALRGEWHGYRSSRLNQQYRVIYRVDGRMVYVFVESITPHDYRRR
jgi:addiction module RelE/StbE family toxin